MNKTLTISATVVIATLALSGCAGLNLPKKTDTTALSTIPIQTVADELFSNKISDGVQNKEWYRENVNGYWPVNYMKAVCYAKQGTISNWNDGSLCEVSGKKIFFLKQVKRTPFNNGVYNEKGLLELRFGDKEMYLLENQINQEKLRMQAMHEKLVAEENQRKQVAIQEQQRKLAYIEQLRQKRGDQVMSFFDGNYVHDTYQSESCKEKCIQSNINSTGYKSLQEALTDGWKFVSKVSEAKQSLTQNCECTGANILLHR